MRNVPEVLLLTTAGVSSNEIARRLGIAASTVRLILQRLARAGLSWPLPAEMSDTVLEARLFTAVGTKQGHRRHPEPDWAAVHHELSATSTSPCRSCGMSTSSSIPMVIGTAAFASCMAVGLAGSR